MKLLQNVISYYFLRVTNTFGNAKSAPVKYRPRLRVVLASKSNFANIEDSQARAATTSVLRTILVTG